MGDVEKTLHPTRESCLKVLGQLDSLSEIEVKDLEIGVYNATIQYIKEQRMAASWNNPAFTQAYLTRCRSIYKSVKQIPRFVDRLHDGEFKPHDMAFMKAENINPERWHDLINRQTMRNKEAYESLMVSNTNRYTCSRCHKKECSYHEKMVRSADEPMTTYIQCLNCGHHWHF